uniref:Protein kinase domain-containing protein n=1 Tax=Haptolina brevifila TaxID=156173 RepID=A0A6U7EPV3_9EUKA|mmetsp:Transcript_37012/g.73934  ORF Transcript_37012/g.73934 Transcript_37012/m.73934 type:complete len:262 (+) Transcript_37012:72-857(+)
MLITEYMPGGDLFQALGRLDRQKMSERHVLGLAVQIISAASYLHGIGIIHCDLKPSNVLVLESIAPQKAAEKKRSAPKRRRGLRRRGHKANAVVPAAPPSLAPSAAAPAPREETERDGEAPLFTIKLADFGLSQLRPTLGPESSDQLYTVQGTPEYFAPELARLALDALTTSGAQASDAQAVDLGRNELPGTGYGKAVDDWAVGCILYEMLVGSPPFGDGGKGVKQTRLYERILKQKRAPPKLTRSSYGIYGRLQWSPAHV